jgi:hypothetical protein
MNMAQIPLHQNPPSKGAVYFQAWSFSFPASMIPCLLGAMLALLMG